MMRLVVIALFTCVLSPFATGQQPISTSLRNSSTLSLASYNLVIQPWTNHYQYAPVSLPVNSTVSFIWQNDDHGVYLLNNDQCPDNFTDGLYGMQELYRVTSETGNYTANYTTVLSSPGIYYFACQEGVHCSQGQRIAITVYDYVEGIPGSVAVGSTPPSIVNLAPNQNHIVPATNVTG